MRLQVLAAAAAVASIIASPLAAQSLPTDFHAAAVFTGRSAPTAVRFSRDGRVYVAEKNGRIFEYDNLLDTSGTAIADLRTNVHNFWDRGLLGLALDPDFPARPYLYVLYTHDAGIGGVAPRWGSVGGSNDGCSGPLANGGPTANRGGCNVSGRLSRLTLAGGATTEEVLVEDWFQQYPSHSVGTVLFGEDGFLYVGAGDGASFDFTDWGQGANPNFPDPDSPTNEGGALRAQDLRSSGDPLTLSGSIIRVDSRTGAAAPGNPLFADPLASENARRMLAHGFRNPYRFTRRPGTSELWIGDVGWSNREEIDVVPALTSATPPAPYNFGWPCYEGAGVHGAYDQTALQLCKTLYTAGTARPPFYAYAHQRQNGANCEGTPSSVTGLAFYRGDLYPGTYRNALFFADYNRDQIFVLRDVDSDGLPDAPTQSGCGSTPEPTPYLFQDRAANNSVVDLTTGPGGDLFFANFEVGTIQRIWFGNNRAPSAAITATPVQGSSTDYAMSATNSVDPDTGDTLSYAWDLDGDGVFDDSSGSASVIATLNSDGVRRLGVRVSDAAGAVDVATMRIVRGNGGPTAQIISPANPSAPWRAGDDIVLIGAGSDLEDGNLSGDALNWSAVLRRCTDETFTVCQDTPAGGAQGNTGVIDGPGSGYPALLRVRLTAQDSTGLTDTRTVDMLPATSDVTANSNPAGLNVRVGGGAPGAAPQTLRVVASSGMNVVAITPQMQSGTEYAFASWSDGGAATHLIAAPASGTLTLTATFLPNADVGVLLSDISAVALGGPFQYTLTLRNRGAGTVTGSNFSHALPAVLQGAAWACTATGGATCPAPSGTGALAVTPTLPAGATLRYVITGTVPGAPPPALAINATMAAPAGTVDPDASDNAVNASVALQTVFADGFE